MISLYLLVGGVLTHWLSTAAAKRKLKVFDDRVRLMTMHCSKGLEFPFVAVAGAHTLPLAKCDEVAEAKLLYVAMTRATDKSMATWCGGEGVLGRLVSWLGSRLWLDLYTLVQRI